MNTSSNWPGGNDLGHSNHTLRFPRTSKYDGVGGFAKDSHDIPLAAWPCVAVVVMVIASAVRIAVWIVQN